MVPVSTDIFRWRDAVRKAILRRKANLSAEWDPVVAAWLDYAFLQDGPDHNPNFIELAQNLERWAQTEDVWTAGRNLGPLCWVGYLKNLRKRMVPEFISKILAVIKTANPESKFSPLRAPEQLLMIARLIGALGADYDKEKKQLVVIIRNQLDGTPRRRMLLLAALNELGEGVGLPTAAEDLTDAGDIIVRLWWSERYDGPGERSAWLKAFAGVYETLALVGSVEANVEDNNRVLAPWELAILYEALSRETESPNPVLLFESYPLHRRLRNATEKAFRSGDYVNAVFEGTKVFNDFLRERTGLQLGEVKLVQKALGDPGSKEIELPLIKINPLDPASRDYVSQQNEQRGFSYLAHGVFFAFRHPKGHEPQDKHWIALDPYEALDQLITTSHLMKRIEGAKQTKRA